MGKYLDYYCGDENRRLKWIVDSSLQKFGGINQCDYDDFYSLAAEVCWKSEEEYDPTRGVPFEPFFRGRLSNKIKTMITSRNRDKRTTKVEVIDEDTGEIRKIPVSDVRIDAPIGDEDGLTIGDTIFSESHTDIYLYEDCNNFQDGKVERYLAGLTKVQRKIVGMKMDGYSPGKIKEALRLSDKKYEKLWKIIISFEKTQLIYENNNRYGEDKDMGNNTQTLETSKEDSIYVDMLIKRMDNKTIKFNHPLQRRSGRWTPIMRSKLVSDILQNNPLPSLVFAEQVVNGSAIIWDLDGKQKCSTISDYIKGKFKISKNLSDERRWNIKYDVPVLENGKEVLDDKGYPINAHKTFDIRKKSFSDLPDELQDRIKAYSFKIVQYLNCTDDDIAYHIERYNEGMQMNVTEKGIIKIGPKFASMVKDISNMELFTDIGEYTARESNNGTTDRVVIESVMAINHIHDWSKSQDTICSYLKVNASEEEFEDFEDIVEAVGKAIEYREDVAAMFNSKNSFLWFALYSKFRRYNLDDVRFADFMEEFSNVLYSKEIDGKSFDSIEFDVETGKKRGTKDTTVVKDRIKILELLMKDFLHIEEPVNEESEDSITIDPEEFVVRNVRVDADILHDDMEFYEQSLNDMLDKYIRDGSKLKDEANRLSLLALMVYAYEIDEDLDEWMEKYAVENNMYFPDQKRNFLHMKHDFDEFVAARQRISA